MAHQARMKQAVPDDPSFYTAVFNNKAEANDIDTYNNFVKWLTDWVEVEV